MAFNEELRWLHLLNEACENDRVESTPHDILESVQRDTDAEKCEEEDSRSITYAYYQCIFASSGTDDESSFSESECDMHELVVYHDVYEESTEGYGMSEEGLMEPIPSVFKRRSVLSVRVDKLMRHLTNDINYLLNECAVTMYYKSLGRVFGDDPEVAWGNLQVRYGTDALYDHSTGQSIAFLSAKQRFLIQSEITEENDEMYESWLLVAFHGSTPGLTLQRPDYEYGRACAHCKEQFTFFGSSRYHCHNCGASVCSIHASYHRRLPHFGLPLARVCSDCAQLIDSSKNTQIAFWRKARCNAYIHSRLVPYGSQGHPDTRLQKLERLAHGVLNVIRNMLASSLVSKATVEGVSLVNRYGRAGLHAALLNGDFLQAACTIRELSGLDSCQVQLHELTACLYYQLAVSRAERGCDPDQQSRAHSACSGCSPPPVALMEEAARFAPLACSAVYQESDEECQRVAASLEWLTVVAELNSRPEKPAFALFASEREAPDKEVVLAIRGTKTLHDLVTDIRVSPVSFPLNVTAVGDEDGHDVTTETWMKIDSNHGTYACRGMARAAEWVFSKMGPLLADLHAEGYRVVVTGHSLGASVAALVTVLLRQKLLVSTPEELRTFGYSCPNCCCEVLASRLEEHMVTIVLGDDFVCRLSPSSVQNQLQHLERHRNAAYYQLGEDWNSLVQRATDLWRPKHRIHPDKEKIRARKGSACISSLLRDTGWREEEGAQNERQPPLDSGLAEIWIPGRIFHIYYHHGVPQIAETPRDHPSLRSLAIQGSMVSDHFAKCVLSALKALQNTYHAHDKPPEWTPFDARDTCQRCENAFSWHSTFASASSEARERHNCRNCGDLVCGPCSAQRQAIPRLGLSDPVRVCIKCYLHVGSIARTRS